MAQAGPTILVVGAGVFGTSTAYHLKQKHPAWSICVVERTPSPPSDAASTDINKIIRADYSVSFYAELAYEAMDAWQNWESLKPYYHRTGWVALDEEGSDSAERIRKVFEERGKDPTTDIPLGELDSHWGGCMKGTDTTGFRDAYWNPEAGWCEADKATASLMDEAVKLGVQYRCGDVASLITEGALVKGVCLKDGTALHADKTIMATGAWTSALLTGTEDELGIGESDRIEKQARATGVAVAHFKMSDEEMRSLEQMPVVVYGEHGEVIPPLPGDCLLKFTNSNTFTNTVETLSGHKISVPPERDQRIVSQKLQREADKTMMNRVMPTFTNGKKAEYWRTCWDSWTPSQDWLLDKHPKIDGLYLAVGGSFHSYKFLPNIGKYMANVVTGKGNGEQKDRAWKWKDHSSSRGGAHESTRPKGELKDFEDQLHRRVT